jgi:hypothetical protein
MALTTRADQYLQLGRNCRLMAQASVGRGVEEAVRQGRLMNDVYWVWRSVARWVRSVLDLATRGLRGRSPKG